MQTYQYQIYTIAEITQDEAYFSHQGWRKDIFILIDQQRCYHPTLYVFENLTKDFYAQVAEKGYFSMPHHLLAVLDFQPTTIKERLSKLLNSELRHYPLTGRLKFIPPECINIDAMEVNDGGIWYKMREFE